MSRRGREKGEGDLVERTMEIGIDDGTWASASRMDGRTEEGGGSTMVIRVYSVRLFLILELETLD